MDGTTNVVQIQRQIIEFKNCFTVTNKNARSIVFFCRSLYIKREMEKERREKVKKKKIKRYKNYVI